MISKYTKLTEEEKELFVYKCTRTEIAGPDPSAEMTFDGKKLSLKCFYEGIDKEPVIHKIDISENPGFWQVAFEFFNPSSRENRDDSKDTDYYNLINAVSTKANNLANNT